MSVSAKITEVIDQEKPQKRRTLTMIRLMTALLTLGVIITTATTAIAAEPEGWCYCNPEAPLCRSICPDRPAVNAFDHHRAAYQARWSNEKSKTMAKVIGRRGVAGMVKPAHKTLNGDRSSY